MTPAKLTLAMFLKHGKVAKKALKYNEKAIKATATKFLKYAILSFVSVYDFV